MMKSMRLGLTALEVAVTSAAIGVIGLCVLIIPSREAPAISASLALVGLALAALAYGKSDEDTAARKTATGGALVGIVVLADIALGLGVMW
jgi:hypothetical protein